MPQINATYPMGFLSDKGTDWVMNISDIQPSNGAVTNTFLDVGEGTADLTADNFNLSYRGGGDNPLDTIKTSSLKFPVVVRSNAARNIIDAIFETNFDVQWFVSLWQKKAGAFPDEHSLFWWGFLSPVSSKKPNTSYPYSYELEALDTLALLRNQKVWSKTFVTNLTLPGTGTIIPIPKHRFGSPRIASVSPVTIYPKEAPTVVQAIYSLIYDLNQDSDGRLRTLMYWDMVRTPQTQTGPLNHTTINIWEEIFTDNPPDPAIGYSIERDTSVTAYEILNRICQLFCLRIFQKDGDYWVVQPEVYQDPAVSVERYSFTKNTVASSDQPKFSGANTVTLSTISQAISSPPTDPYILSGAAWERIPSLHEVVLSGTLVSGVMSWRVKQKISGTTNNLSDLSGHTQEIDTKYPIAELNYLDFGPSTGYRQEWTRGANPSAAFDTYTTCVKARMESRNKLRELFDATIYTPNYHFLNAIKYDGTTFIPHAISLNGNSEHWSGRWIEMRLESGALGEPIGEEITEGEHNQSLEDLIRNALGTG